jgi:uncharacterized protein YlxP (DUF503 family)
MVVASLTWELSLPGCSSLKEKRSIIRSLKDRLRSKLNVSVAETAFHDLHGRAELTIALVASDKGFADSVMEKADRLVEMHAGAIITSVHRELHR